MSKSTLIQSSNNQERKMSNVEESSLEDLFQSLKDATKQEVSKTAPQEENHDSNVLQLDNDEEDKTQNTEKVFRDIERDLKKLPKLENGFDRLASKRQNKKDKETELPTIPTGNEKKKSNPTRDWFTLPKPTDHMKKALQRDMLLIKHRAALDPKRHYKKDKWKVPDRFSVGTIIEDKTEFFSSRLTNKQRKSTMLETLMTDDDSNKYFKRKYSEIQNQKTSGKKGHYKKNKDMRRKY